MLKNKMIVELGNKGTDVMVKSTNITLIFKVQYLIIS